MIRNSLLVLATALVLGTTACSNDSTSNAAAPAVPEKDIFSAILEADLATVETHLAAGTSVDLREPTGNATPLITACLLGDKEIVDVLLAAGADLEARNNDGSTALMTAAFLAHIDVVQALVDAGADIYVKDKNSDMTPGQTAALPWQDVKPIYDLLTLVLTPTLGVEIDYDRIQADRPTIAEMLK